MKIWANGKWYDHKKELIVVYLTDKDKENIKNMHPDCVLYSQYEKDIIPTDEVIKKLKELREEVDSEM